MTAVEGLKGKMEKKKKAKVLKVHFCFTYKLGFYPIDNTVVMKAQNKQTKKNPKNQNTNPAPADSSWQDEFQVQGVETG